MEQVIGERGSMRVKAQVSDLGLRRWTAVPPASGGVLAGVPPGQAGGTGARWNGESDQCFEDVGRLCLHAGKDMLVDLDSECGRVVAESFADDFDGNAGFDEQGGVGMT